METTVEQTENIENMATPKRQTKAPAKKRTTTSKPLLITRRKALPKPKRRK